MGKHEVGTPKYIANKIKAKGLQKLRWYCQMCQKQCRDENGFKCHTTSESHQRQLLIFADNADKYIDEFSKEFEEGYCELLKRQFGTKRVNANRVYQDYISDRNHLHMNSTQWETLTEFVKWLGREGKCVVDETEKGWFVQYIDRDPETIALQEAMAKKEKMEKDDSEKMMEFLEKQIERGKEFGKQVEHQPTELVRDEKCDPISINIPTFKKPEPKLNINFQKSQSSTKREESFIKPESSKNQINKKPEKKKLSALDEIMKEEEDKRKKVPKKDYWLSEDIVVKIVTDSLGEKYFKKKGVVIKVIDKFCGKVRLLDSEVKLKLDQAHLETVIPAVGRLVKILNGAYTGLTAELLDIDVKNYCVNVKLISGPLSGKMIRRLPYEDVSKLHIS
uniref:DNA/RNA-binding protein Kin17 WH-like domain-containing protein n=1 Tax=Homalodisca liturata TaxID=320908 RepID=A0A1B6HNE3_9HEMI